MAASSPQCGSFDYPFCTDQVRAAPAGLCCRSGMQCQLFAANSTVVCCDGPSCNTIDAISCDINQQVFPADVLTTVLKGDLPRCGDQCCPWGFHCNPAGDCQANEDQDELPDPVEFPSVPGHSSISSSYSDLPRPSAKPMTSSLGAHTAPNGSPMVTGSPYPVPVPVSNQVAVPTRPDMTKSDIVGLAIGGLFGIVFVILAVYFLRQRKLSKTAGDAEEGKSPAGSTNEQQPPAGFNVPPGDMEGDVVQIPELDSNPIYELRCPEMEPPEIYELEA